MDPHFRQHYQVLNLKPEHGWDQLRDAYKKAIRRWHPDRYRDDTERLAAEEKTKLINRAYAELSEYRDRHGDLPYRHPERNATFRPANTPPPVSRGAPSNPSARVDTASPAPPPTLTNSKTYGRLPVATLVGIVVVAGYFAIRPSEMPELQLDADPGNRPLAGSPPQENPPLPTRATFTVGSSVGEVHAIQGIPMVVDHDVWQYGEARVRFSHGRVVDWDDPTGSILHVRTATTTIATKSATFGIGSDKATVLTIQGAPIRESAAAWEYGPSRIFFRGNRVSGWHESPLHPLKVNR